MIAQDQARKINPQLSGLDVPPPGLTNFDLHQQAKPITPGARAEYNALQIAKTQALPMELRNATAPGAFNGNIFGMKPRADGGKAVRKALMVAKDDAGKTMPESARVLHLQRQALLAGKRKAMLFPKGGGKESVVPPGMERMDTPDGVIHYNPAMVSEREIAQAVKNKRLNEVLGLGPYSKGDVVKRVAKGEKPVAVVARDPHGVEAAAALGTAGTAPEQLPHIAAQMPAAGSVGLENPAETVLRRADGGEVEDYLPPDHPDRKANLEKFLEGSIAPHVQYHGTTSEDIKAFRTNSRGPKLMDGLGAHFGTQKAAHDRIAQNVGQNAENSNILPVYLSIKNPPLKRDGLYE